MYDFQIAKALRREKRKQDQVKTKQSNATQNIFHDHGKQISFESGSIFQHTAYPAVTAPSSKRSGTKDSTSDDPFTTDIDQRAIHITNEDKDEEPCLIDILRVLSFLQIF